MLKIKKTPVKSYISYTAQFLLRNTNYSKQYNVIKKKNISIHLRAPKHFNIGKQKIINLNDKIINLNIYPKYPINLAVFIQGSQTLYWGLAQKFQWNTYVFPKSIKLSIKTKILLTWLEF